MTRDDYDDKHTAILFSIVGILGVPPALYKLFTVGWLAVMSVATTVEGSMDMAGTLVVCLGIIGVTMHGFWLLWQYLKRARGKPASVSQRTLWQLTTVQNTIYLLASIAIFVMSLGASGYVWGLLASLWFSGLVWCSARAAIQSPPTLL
jgi:hypothetical protein